jgi:hypothetical protein
MARASIHHGVAVRFRAKKRITAALRACSELLIRRPQQIHGESAKQEGRHPFGRNDRKGSHQREKDSHSQKPEQFEKWVPRRASRIRRIHGVHGSSYITTQTNTEAFRRFPI